MAKRRVHLTFPENLVQEPIIFNLGKQFDIVTNIRRANVEDNFGWVILELDGDEKALDRGLKYLEERGVQVNTIAGDVVEG
ncbi:MAG TPA: NIL domain-containing protein [Actinomycetota bacterium]|nr:NIL domain-containing protein [Actinomycetota bacterium]